MRIFWVIFREIFAGYYYVRRFSRKYETESFVSILHDFPVKDVNLICFSSSVEGNEFPASNRKDFPFLPSPPTSPSLTRCAFRLSFELNIFEQFFPLTVSRLLL